jgi:hypothetical protein
MPIVLTLGALAVASLVAMLGAGALIGLLTLLFPAQRGGGRHISSMGVDVSGLAAPSLIAKRSRVRM